MRRIAGIALAVVMLWIVLLAILGPALSGRAGDSVTARVADSMRGEGSYRSSSLSLVGGGLEVTDLAIRRSEPIGHLSLDVAKVSCDLPPLGLALVDRDCHRLALEGVRFELSTFALFTFKKPAKPPMHARSVVIDDARLVFSPSAVLPGVGGIEIAIEHAEAGPTNLRTPISWLMSLRQLRAVVKLPAGMTVAVAYAGGVLTASGGLFGSTPVRIPITIPVARASDDTRDELKRLVELGRSIATALLEQRAEDWLRSKL